MGLFTTPPALNSCKHGIYDNYSKKSSRTWAYCLDHAVRTTASSKFLISVVLFLVL